MSKKFTGPAKTTLKETVQGKKKKDRQRKKWQDNNTEWTGNAL